MSARDLPSHHPGMPEFVIHHQHSATECGAVFASFQGVASPVRQQPAAVSCDHGGHDIWWCVQADTLDGALELLPRYVASRATATRIERTLIP